MRKAVLDSNENEVVVVMSVRVECHCMDAGVIDDITYEAFVG